MASTHQLVRRAAMFFGVTLALSTAIAGCATTATVHVPAPTATSTATATATATAIPTVAPGVIAACFGSSAKPADVTLSGDFLFAKLDLGFLTYPSVMLPDGTPTGKPYKLTAPGPDDYTTDFPSSPITNPQMSQPGGGFVVSVCNVSGSTSHVLQAISAKLISYTAYNGSLSEWQACNSPVDSHHNLTPGGCGGAVAGCDCFHTAFPDNSPIGTEEVMTQTDDSDNNPGDHLAKLPFTLAPGKSLSLFVAMDVPKPAGQYGFLFNLQFDGTKVASPNSPVVLLAPVAHEWTGDACLQAPFTAQITPTNPESYYICPK